jgi:hypothetical protein
MLGFRPKASPGQCIEGLTRYVIVEGNIESGGAPPFDPFGLIGLIGLIGSDWV